MGTSALAVEHRYRAEILRAADADADGCAALAALRADPTVRVHDELRAQVADLIKTRRPADDPTPDELADLVDEHLAGRDPDEVGVWAHYPWSGRLVHLLDEADFTELRTDRNHDKITVEEQRELGTKAIGVVGLSVGSAVALTIALERGCGTLRLADFDVIDLSNLNRLRCGVHEIGIPKPVVAARAIAEIDPFLTVECCNAGVDESSIEDFLDGLDLVVDECDSWDVKLDLRIRCRDAGIPIVMALSDRGTLDVERYDLDPSLPLYLGTLDGLAPAQLRALDRAELVDVLKRTHPPEEFSDRLRDSIANIGTTLRTWPQLAADVEFGAGQVAEASRRILLGEDVPSGRTFVS